MWTTLARPFWPISCSVYINEQSSANSHSCIGCRPVACGIVMGKGFEYNWFTLRNRSYNFDSQSAVTCWLSANINSQLSLRAISNRFLVLYFYHYRVSRLHLYCSADLADLQNLGCLPVTQWVYCMESGILVDSEFLLRRLLCRKWMGSVLRETRISISIIILVQ